MSTTASQIRPLPHPRPDIVDYKRSVGRFPTGLTVLTSSRDHRYDGVTVSAFMSVSLNPTLVATGLRRGSRFVEQLSPGCAVGVNILAETQWPVAQLFADPNRERGIEVLGRPLWTPGRVNGAPLLDDCAAKLECKLNNSVPAGDHVLLVLQVLRAHANPARRPLVHFAGAAHALRNL